MSNVTLTIGGRQYTVACAPGEEAHVTRLGASIDAKLSGMPGLATQSEARTLLYGALLLADELHELQQIAPGGSSPQVDEEALEALATRLEDLASQLENR